MCQSQPTALPRSLAPTGAFWEGERQVTTQNPVGVCIMYIARDGDMAQRFTLGAVVKLYCTVASLVIATNKQIIPQR